MLKKASPKLIHVLLKIDRKKPFSELVYSLGKHKDVIKNNQKINR